ncbi:MAG: hypothetical protein HY040_22455 [Planctomycetes bacterium]|nr:hypothetical protein [Planctomycetota bacterium]
MAKLKTRIGSIKNRARSNGRPSPNGASARRSKWLLGNPEWEAMKARCRNISHADAVRECDEIGRVLKEMWFPRMLMVDLKTILQTLIAKKIPFVLTGAHGISGWTGRPRATKDVDILVKSGRNYVRAVNAMKALYPQLEVRRFAGVMGFFPPGETDSVIDVTYPHREDNVETLRTAIWVEDKNGKYRIPTLEAALANKYGAMLALNRDAGKRGMDAVDFYNMVKHSMDEGRTPIELERLAELGENVWPRGGGKEILRLVEQVKAGKVPSVAASPNGI